MAFCCNCFFVFALDLSLVAIIHAIFFKHFFQEETPMYSLEENVDYVRLGNFKFNAQSLKSTYRKNLRLR